MNKEVMEQIKFTDKNSYSISVGEWRKLKRDALNADRDPRMVIEFREAGIRLIVVEG